MSSDWIPLDLDKLSKPFKQEIRGVQLSVFMSPHDVPEAVRGRYDDKKERFVVEFRYIGEEPTTKSAEKDHIALLTGKNSRRLYEIEIDVNALKAKAVGLQLGLVDVPKAVEDAIDDLAKAAKDLEKAAKSILTSVEGAVAPNQRNYEVAKEAIAETKEEIFAELAT